MSRDKLVADVLERVEKRQVDDIVEEVIARLAERKDEFLDAIVAAVSDKVLVSVPELPPTPKPAAPAVMSPGRLVHYIQPGTRAHLVGIVIWMVPDGRAHIVYWTEHGGQRVALHVREGTFEDTWHWPERN